MNIIFPDTYIEYWADVYLDTPEIAARGVLFIAFLQAPADLYRWATGQQPPAREDVTDYAPLLPAQQVVADRLACQRAAERITADWRERQHGNLTEAEFDTLVAEIEAEIAHPPEAHCRDGRLIEPLRHHAFPNRNTFRRVV